MKRIIVSLILPLGFFGCGSSSSSGSDCTPGAGGNKAQYVVNKLTVPTDKSQFAIDLTGSGHSNNQLGNIIGTLIQQGFDVQTGVDKAVQSGTLVVLLSQNSADATFTTDSCAQATVQVGKSVTTAPKFDGSDTFTVDASQQGGTFAGPIKAGTFESAQPATTKNPVTVQLGLPLVSGAPPVPLKVIGAYTKFTSAGGKSIMNGQIDGAIKKSDVDMNIIPYVAKLLTNVVMMRKANCSTDSTCMNVESLFDTGGCTNPSYGERAGMAAAAMDFIIDTCELAQTGLIKQILAPDVQMFDASGNYAPNPSATMKDSLSLGLSFTAVGAKF